MVSRVSPQAWHVVGWHVWWQDVWCLCTHIAAQSKLQCTLLGLERQGSCAQALPAALLLPILVCKYNIMSSLFLHQHQLLVNPELVPVLVAAIQLHTVTNGTPIVWVSRHLP